MASGGTLSSSTGCTDHCSCTANSTGASWVTASLSASRVPVSSGFKSGMAPWAASAAVASVPAGRRVSRSLSTCVSLSEFLAGAAAAALAGAAGNGGGARIRRVSPVALASPKAFSTSRTFESPNAPLGLSSCAGSLFAARGAL